MRKIKRKRIKTVNVGMSKRPLMSNGSKSNFATQAPVVHGIDPMSEKVKKKDQRDEEEEKEKEKEKKKERGRKLKVYNLHKIIRVLRPNPLLHTQALFCRTIC